MLSSNSVGAESTAQSCFVAPEMAGRLFYVVAAVVALAAAAASASTDAVGFQRVLSLERAFPVKEDLEVSKARDRARRGRMLQSYSGGIVDFTVDGTSDPYAVG